VTTVVNLHKSDYDTYIGRGSPWGNPIRSDARTSRYDVIEQYRQWFLGRIREDAEFRAATETLRGKRLGCFCKPKLCHGDVIVAYLNGELDAGLSDFVERA
jgi:hypothetical protein